MTRAEHAAPTRLKIHEIHRPPHDFLPEVIAGLTQPQKRLPCKYFYDAGGSELFEQICKQPEYYITRVETAILQKYGQEMAEAIGRRGRLAEFGSGASLKTHILLKALQEPADYVPIDISRTALIEAAARIDEAFPDLTVMPIVADYTQSFELPRGDTEAASTSVFIPGSTIGNFERADAIAFLRRIAELAGTGGGLLIGIDLQKERHILEAAYNDAAGVTAAFNLNILRVVNRRCGTNFNPELFRHEAVYDEGAHRIEMRLVSSRDHDVRIGHQAIELRKDEFIITEYSHKFTIDGFSDLAGRAGMKLKKHWQDAESRFAEVYYEVDPELGN